MSVRLLALALCCTIPALAQEAPTPTRAVLNGLSLRDYSVTVDADEQLARVVVEQTFYNPRAAIAEADFYFAMPAGAASSGLELKMGGRYYGGNLLKRDRARRIYGEITRRNRDPALLDCVGQDLYRCRVFPIPARGNASVKFAFRHAVEAQEDMRRLVVPLDATRFNRRAADTFSLKIRLRTKRALQAILCPSHDVRITRLSARAAVVTLKAKRATLAGDLVLLYAVDDAPMGAVMASYKYPGKPGYFVLSVDAAFAREAQRHAARDVVLAVDTSNSTGSAGVATSAAAVAEAIRALRPGKDRLALMAFATEARLLWDYRTVDEDTPEQVRALFATQPVAGRTRLSAALKSAADVAGKGLPGTGIILLTDGHSTEEEGGSVAKTASAIHDDGHRVGVCGVGAHADTVALDAIGAGGHGDSAYAVRGRALSGGVRHLLDTTKAVPLTDVTVSIPGTHDLYPRKVRMVKGGDSILVAGRYGKGGVVKMTVRGKVAGQVVTRTLKVLLTSLGGDPAVARLWATRRVGHLLDKARAAGKPALHRDEIQRIGHKFGIVTPHTSALVLEEADQQRYLKGMQRQSLMNTEGSETIQRRGTVTSELSGSAEVAERIREMRRCKSGAANPFSDLLGENRLRVRRAGGRTFYRSADGVWTEAELWNEKVDAKTVVFLSDAWMALRDRAAPFLAVGRDVLFRLDDDTVVRVAAQ